MENIPYGTSHAELKNMGLSNSLMTVVCGIFSVNCFMPSFVTLEPEIFIVNAIKGSNYLQTSQLSAF